MRATQRPDAGMSKRRLASTTVLILAMSIAAGSVVVGASPRPTQMSALPAPYGLARNGSLAFERDEDIWLADSDGSHPRAIVGGPDRDGQGPTFSHDGTQIAFIRTATDGSQQTMVSKADGSGLVPVWAGPIDWGTWSSDDRSLVLHTLGTDPALTIVAADGSGSATLDVGALRPTGWADFRPPDGQELIFTAYPSGTSTDVGLYRVHRDGSGLRAIGAAWTADAGTATDGTQLPARQTELAFDGPVISPDGSTLAYSNWEANPSHAVADHDMYVRDLTTGEEQVAPFRSPAVENALIPHYSPDGAMVLFESHTAPGSLEHMFWGPADGSAPSVPIGPGYSYTTRQGFDVSPDGTKVFLTVGSPAATLIIDIATGATVTVNEVGTLPTWQRLAR